MNQPGLFISFEGTEGSGKSTQVVLLSERLRGAGHTVRALREPGGTLIGEEIRHTLKHSPDNAAMCPEAELLLMNASRAQLVREVIAPALDRGEIVLVDRFFDSTTAYQAYGRQLSLECVQAIIDFAVGTTRPDLTFFLDIPLDLSSARRLARAAAHPQRDRFEEADPSFFLRVEEGYHALLKTHPERIHRVDGTQPAQQVGEQIWIQVQAYLAQPPKTRTRG